MLNVHIEFMRGTPTNPHKAICCGALPYAVIYYVLKF